MTDPIADMLTRIRNAVTARHARVEMPASKLKAEIARILQDEGYIAGFKMVETPASHTSKASRQQIRLFLKYGASGDKAISGLERVSRPGRRVYASRDEVPAVLGGLGVSILTTSRGVMTGQAAKRAGVGGEILCNVW
jgi:small subunit ribosomal protein S8